MRPIMPLDITGITPADLTGMKQPEFEIVDPKELWVEDEEGAQREFVGRSRRLGLKIVETFKWRNLVVPTVTRVDGRLLVLNGQTTAIACASHPDVTAIPVLIVDAPVITDRAGAFVSHSRDHVQASPTQIWKGLVTAGDEKAIEIDRVCSDAGLKLCAVPPQGAAYKPGESIALAAIDKLIQRRGPLKASVTLRALALAELAPVTADWIKAADSLLNDEEYALEMDGQRLTATIKALGPRAYADMRELAAAKHLPAWKALTAVAFKNRVKRAGKAVQADPELPHPVVAEKANGRFFPGQQPRYGR